MSPPIPRASCFTEDSPKPAPPKREAMVTLAWGERAEQPLDLGHGQADAAVGHREGDADPALHLVVFLAFGWTPRRDHERHAALVGELHRIVDEVLECSAQADGIADHQPWQLFGELDLGLEALGRGAPGERIAGAAGQRPQVEQILPQRAATLPGSGGVHEQGGEARQMLGTGLDGVSPAPLPLPEIRGREQVADRENAGQGRADLMGKGGKRRLDHVRRDHFGGALAHLSGRPGPLPRQSPGRPRSARWARFRRHNSPSKYPLRTPGPSVEHGTAEPLESRRCLAKPQRNFT
ncbi:hypothetical protein ABIF43_001020 [Bradyrhizobium japonicum]